MEAKATGLNRR